MNEIVYCSIEKNWVLTYKEKTIKRNPVCLFVPIYKE